MCLPSLLQNLKHAVRTDAVAGAAAHAQFLIDCDGIVSLCANVSGKGNRLFGTLRHAIAAALAAVNRQLDFIHGSSSSRMAFMRPYLRFFLTVLQQAEQKQRLK